MCKMVWRKTVQYLPEFNFAGKKVMRISPAFGPVPQGKLRDFGMGSKDRFVMLDHWLLESEAWRALSPGASRLLIEVWARHNGQNNGHISYSVREAAELLGVSKDTASKWFHELEAKGFLKARQRGAFSHE